MRATTRIDEERAQEPWVEVSYAQHMPARELDDTDRQIIHCLQGDARNVTTADIGRELDVSGSTVANRISQLEDDGIITGYTPVIDYERSGYRQHHLLLGTVAGENRQAVLDAIPNQSGVINVTSLLADERNVVIEIIGREPEEIETVVESISDLGVTVLRTDLVTSEVARAFDGFGDRRNSDT